MSAIPPVIVLGMHRSGTGLLVRIMERFGFFMGAQQELNHEANFFLRINQWLFAQLGATWDEPANAVFLPADTRQWLTAALEHILQSEARAEFLGAERAASCRSVRNLDIPWGWKDPRNVWTLELWRGLFPDAKVLHIYRNPVDVAASLRQRELEYAGKVAKAIEQQGLAAFMERIGKFQTSGRVRVLAEGVRLWEQYVNRAFEAGESFPGGMFSVSYEQLLSQPRSTLAGIARFLGVNEDLAAADFSDLLDSKRCLAFRDDPELCRLYESIRLQPLMQRLGYAQLI